MSLYLLPVNRNLYSAKQQTRQIKSSLKYLWLNWIGIILPIPAFVGIDYLKQINMPVVEYTGKENPIYKYFYHYTFAAMFGGIPIGQNYYTRRPLYTGIHRHILWGMLGLAVGHYLNRYIENKWVERDAIIRHYVELHPEDFTEEKKKYKEILEEWYPVR